MSLNRLLFRTLTVAALTQQDYDAAPPTIAGEAVFDSRLDPIEFDTDKIEVPIATVYTEEDQLTLLDRGAGRGAYQRTITLRIDICVGSFQKSVENKQTKIAYSIPTTDAELEAVLDLFEGQVWRALNTTGRPISDLWQGIVQKISEVSSRPAREEHGNNRLAARSLMFTCQIVQDCIPQVQIYTRERENDLAAKGAQPTLISQAPYLNSMLSLLPDSPSMKGLIDVLNNTPILLPQFKYVTVNSRLCVNSKNFASFTKDSRPPNALDLRQTWTIP